MVHRNPNFSLLRPTYLFVEIANRRREFCQANPGIRLISLGVGDTTEPLSPQVVSALKAQADRLSKAETYTGYPEYNGTQSLRDGIANKFYSNLNIKNDEIFISDGSKPDLARIQHLFDKQTTVAVQDPVYPVYVDGSVISGKAGAGIEAGEGGAWARYDKVVYLDCVPENDFFPELPTQKESPPDLIYFCSPNNPTGAAATRAQLERLVQFAKEKKSIIIYDSAYSLYIRNEDAEKFPRSIYQIPGAKEVALETSSFSKFLGFTGVRLGWTVCPRELKYSDGSCVRDDWSRIMATCFNGPSNLSEAGALAAVSSDEGWKEMLKMVDFYSENARLILEALTETEEMRNLFECYGGKCSPYIWVRLHDKKIDAWEVFQRFMTKMNIIITPGVGFGKNGQSFFRISAFAHREDVLEALQRIKKHCKTAF